MSVHAAMRLEHARIERTRRCRSEVRIRRSGLRNRTSARIERRSESDSNCKSKVPIRLRIRTRTADRTPIGIRTPDPELRAWMCTDPAEIKLHPHKECCEGLLCKPKRVALAAKHSAEESVHICMPPPVWPKGGALLCCTVTGNEQCCKHAFDPTFHPTSVPTPKPIKKAQRHHPQMDDPLPPWVNSLPNNTLLALENGNSARKSSLS